MTNSLIPFIGVTGGIGSGKSIVCRIFYCLGIPVFDADKEAKVILNQNETVKNSIKDLLGTQSYTAKQTYNPTWVRAKISENPSLIPLINSIVHPAVRNKAQEWHKKQKNKPFLIYESALIHGKNKPEIMTKLIVLSSPIEDRIKRIESRNQLSISEIDTMMQIQPSEEMYLKDADFLVKNSSEDLIWPQIEKIYKSLSGLTLALLLLMMDQTSP